MARIRSKKQLEEKIDELRELEAIVAEAEAEIESIKDEIKQYLGESELISTDKYKVHWTRFSQSRFDSKAFKKRYPEMYDQYTKLTEMRRFSISDK